MRCVSSRYEVVFTCFLRDDTPASVLAALRWHLGKARERPTELDGETHAYPLLEPDADSRLPGGDFASLTRQARFVTGEGEEHHAWGLFTRNYWLDDDMEELVTVLDLLAPHVEDPGYGGYFREEDEAEPTAFTFHDRTYGPLGG